MKKGGFDMYLTKEKSGTTLYRNYDPKFSNHKDVEVQAYIAYAVSNDLSKKMKSTVDCMTNMIVQGFAKGGKWVWKNTKNKEIKTLNL